MNIVSKRRSRPERRRELVAGASRTFGERNGSRRSGWLISRRPTPHPQLRNEIDADALGTGDQAPPRVGGSAFGIVDGFAELIAESTGGWLGAEVAGK